jgi:hypothetical protein
VGSVEVVAHDEAVDLAFASSKADDLRALGAVMAAGGMVMPLLPDVGPLCPLRRVTGVPCPFCGMTTGVLALCRGDLAGAFAANPAAPLLVAAVVIAFLPFVYRSGSFGVAASRLRPVGPLLPWLLLPVLWVWELHRFDRL